MCECLDEPQFAAWFTRECNLTATTNNTQAASTNTDMFKNVESITVLVAIMTGIAMTALIWLSVMFSRYRKRNQVVVQLEAGMAAAKKAVADANAYNKELKASLYRAQKEVDKAVGDADDLLKQYKIKYAELAFEDEIGHGQVCCCAGHPR